MPTVPDIDVYWLRSRVMRAVYYERHSRKMIVQTAHGKFLIYTDINQDVMEALASHASPGMIYDQTLRAALRPKLARMTLANFTLLRRIRKIRQAASETAPDDHADRRPNTSG